MRETIIAFLIVSLRLVGSLSIEAIVGTLIGSGITLLATYLTHNFSEKREKLQAVRRREEEAISQVYSPLVFMLDKIRKLFAMTLATKETLKRVPETEDEQKISLFIINYLTAREAAVHPKALEDMLMHKSGLIESTQFYADLLILQSYLSTIVSFLDFLIPKSSEKPTQLRQYILSLGPIFRILDDAISEMRKYAMTKTSRQTITYKQFFTEQKYSELEGYINEANKVMTGHEVMDWNNLLKRLNED
jgi:hypothetical protein